MKLPSLSARIAFMLAVAVALIVGGAALLMDHMVDAEMGRRFDASLVSQARAVASLIEVDTRKPDMDELRHAASQLLLGNANAAFDVDCSDGYHIESRPRPEAYPARWRQRADFDPQFADLDAHGHALRAVWFSFHPGVGEEPASYTPRPGGAMTCKLLLLQPHQQLDEILYTIDAILLIIPLLALVMVILLTPALVRRGLLPLAALGERMRRIGPDVPDQRLPSGHTRELAPLVERFNEVLERMEAGMLRERRFAGALAHETRTRLTELRALVDVEHRHPSGRPMQEVLEEIGLIGNELEETVTGLLLLTRLEAGIERVQRQQVDVRSIIDKQLEAVSELAARRGIRIRLQPPPQPIFLIGDASVLGIVFGNLLRNAVAYAPHDSGVDLAWDESTLRLVNAAPDLTPEDVAQFGQRYWRKHSGESDGVHAGLGLSLAAAAAAALGLDLRFRLDAGQRLEATLVWPPGRVASGA